MRAAGRWWKIRLKAQNQPFSFLSHILLRLGALFDFFFFYYHSLFTHISFRSESWQPCGFFIKKSVCQARVHCACELVVIWSEQEHKEAYSLYFSIYRPSPLAGMYHSAFTLEKGGAQSSARIHSEFIAAPFYLNLPATSAEIDSACPFKPRRHPYRLLSAKK